MHIRGKKLKASGSKPKNETLDRLYVMDGPIKNASFELHDGTTSIGRSTENDICLADERVSSHHARFIKNKNKLIIIDLSEFQGIYVDGVKIASGQEVEIKRDTHITLGNTVLSFQKGSPAHDSKISGSEYLVGDVLETKDRIPAGEDSRNLTNIFNLLIRVSQIFSRSTDINRVLGALTKQIFELLKRINRCVILMPEEGSNRLKEVVSKSRLDSGSGSKCDINYSKTIVHRVFKDGKAVMLANTKCADRADLSESIEIMNIMSVMCVPIKYRGEVRGIIYVDSIGSPYGFRKDDLRLLAGIGNTAAIAIENARLYQAMKKELAERKQAEAQLRDTCVELNETKDMLIHSEKLAAIGRLTAGVAHEILNPVNIISMRLQLLEQTEKLTDQAKEALVVCHEQLRRIFGITKDLGQFSRVTVKKIVPCHINELLQHVLTLSAPYFKKEEITLKGQLDHSLPPVPVDRDRMEQVFLNILTNGTEAMAGQKEKRFQITTKLSNKKNGVQVIISDTGPGITPADMGKIFDPFFTTKDPDQGTGLGLFISYNIVKEHDGRIWAENNSKGGASLIVELPIKEKKEVTMNKNPNEKNPSILFLNHISFRGSLTT